MLVAVAVFPGTNCEIDTKYAFEKLGQEVVLVFHKEEKLPEGTDLVVLPGGFSYGDYLRSAAIAKFSPIMKAVIAFAQQGGKVLGICNGFQMLVEARLLPGAMKRNENVHFISQFHHLKVVHNDNTFLRRCSVGEVLNIPIAHGEGSFYIDPEGLKELYAKHQVLLTYCDEKGTPQNPNGSIDAIAGICNEAKNVFGLMPHPERAIEAILGSDDGVKMLRGFLD
ncbi:MAG: phosphoribosylformylglycinamidine synthase subunit PurQ [Epsilonproteobacteria bacterium]|jgi:phosphoribosylformylglycinamidine synthase|uniref:phosphoribosylformylglycinamidine synthase subunit PurQ n=1 Tax=Sulfurospirillum TaxID=57665 RepID=UPI0005428DFD|nr:MULTISPECIES: phosphoribosylformylglycinamidine synthase subunit PurQ [Sulfurospirillum]NCB55142.1 phosphoribosylformylglycinamidine synthase subunit PurQ [Campylobacterota bacterium]KHG34312.1 MAG: phosphoribosylformylglycinamidine synthase [Sulfurospirillum sp. MES]MCD8544976.1 phosphoribosylformylglycinamidine synthase subunit PurQ [Sulfurospirillum cavolei]MCP3650963.1 phosphoribosylformylglycinamidine synthase subunit PurQ [Sulfurospirillum sp. DNRA8]MCR1809809.1 phosphoribosylformylgl